MKRIVVPIMAALILVPMTRTALGQARTVRSEMRTETATVEAIESQSRTITLKKSDGTFVTTVAGPDIKRFDEVKVGDKVNVRYYDTVVIRLKHPGESEVDNNVKATTGSEQELPGGTKARQRTITATISAIDLTAATVTFTGPNGWKYTSKVQDTDALAKVNVGDKVDIVWTEAVLVSVERGE
jgi:hypothetical protein